MIIDSIEYSVCQDCLFYVAYGDVEHENETVESMVAHEAREKGDKKAFFVTGIEYEEFSWSCCELCRSSLGGSRHGVTLLIHDE